MTSKKKSQRAAALAQKLSSLQANSFSLPGLTAARLECLALQLSDSIQRVDYAKLMGASAHSPRFSDPNDILFDPLRAAASANHAGDIDEAHWLVFLGTHFGKHQSDKWRLASAFYGALGAGPNWTWQRLSSDLAAFDRWAAIAIREMRNDGVSRRFSNHRKYESLDRVPSVFRSYVEWILAAGGHANLVRTLHNRVGQNPKAVFAALYEEMSVVRQFGRLAKFDYLAMLGKLGISPIEPDAAYLSGATGPRRGARLLFGGHTEAPLSNKELQARLDELADELQVGMQVMEDALCNWQKSPETYAYFSG